MERLLFTILVIMLCVTSTAYAAQYYQVNNSATDTINEHGTCKKVSNFCGKDLFVPTNTAAEWSDFRADAPGCVSITDCGIACGTLVQNLICTGTSLIGTSIGSAAACEVYCEQQVTGTCCHWGSGEGGGFCEVRDGSTTTGFSSDYSSNCT